jgi:hypothetical protein
LSKVAWLFCGTLALTLIASVACSGSGDSSAPETSTQAAAPTQAAATVGSGEQAGFARAASAVKSYRTTFTVELPSKVVERGTLAFLQPDRSHFTLTVSGTTNEVIAVGSDRYAKTPSGGWMKLQSGGLPRVVTATGGLDQLAGFRSAAQAGTLTKGGSDTVNNARCDLYSHSLNGHSIEYCVAQDLPLRMKIVMGTDGSIVTFFFSDYNQAIQIDPPI